MFVWHSCSHQISPRCNVKCVHVIDHERRCRGVGQVCNVVFHYRVSPVAPIASWYDTWSTLLLTLRVCTVTLQRKTFTDVSVHCACKDGGVLVCEIYKINNIKFVRLEKFNNIYSFVISMDIRIFFSFVRSNTIRKHNS